MALDKKTLELLVGLLGGETRNTHSLEVGKAYLFRCIPLYYLGRIKAITDTDIVLVDASWLASTKRWFDTLKDGVCDEVEPYLDECIVSRAVIADVTPWRHALPAEQL